MKSGEATVHVVANLIQSLEVDMETKNVRDDTLPITYGEEGTELAQFDAL